MNEKKDVEKYCQTIIRVYEILPYSEYITNGYYAIATNKPIQLTQACKQLSASFINVKAPLDIVQLKPSCSMTHQNLILPAYYYKESKYNLTEHLNRLKLKYGNLYVSIIPISRSKKNYHQN